MKKILFFILLFILLFSCTVQADKFTQDFYTYVNIKRESVDLLPLRRDKNIEEVAYTYSSILAELGHIDHEAITDYEFSSLCSNYGVPEATLLEILAFCPEDYVPYQVLLLFLMSEPHKAAIYDPRGRFIGAGYVKEGDDIYFTAYIMIE